MWPAAVATAASPLQRRLQQPADESLRARCLRVVVGVRGFVHVDALAGFQLHRFDAIAGIAVTADDVAALEAAVGDETVVVLRRKHLLQARLQRRRTARAVRGAAIGRESCRERVCQYVSISVVAVSLKKKKK